MLRTRIWSSLRAQTLYRTVSGMMNYGKAIKLLYCVGNPKSSKPLVETLTNSNANWNQWHAESSSSSFSCNKIRSSIRRNTSTPNSCSVHTPSSRLQTLRKNLSGRKGEILDSFLRSSVAIPSSTFTLERGGRSSGSSFLVTPSSETESQTTRTTLSFSTVANTPS